MIRDISFALAHGKLAGITLGNPNAPVVLCLHGWLDNCASFLPFFNTLIAQDSELLTQYQFVAVDWPGHGQSEHRSKDAHYHFIDWCYDLLQLLEVNQWQQISIIGHSMGGMVATLFTSAFNDKVDKLILIEAIGLLTQNENPSEQLRKGMLSRLQLQNKQATVHKNIDAAVKARMNVSDLADTDAKLLVERGLHAVEDGVTWRSDARLRNVSPQRFALKQAIQVVANLHCPVTLVLGENGFDMVQTGVKIFAEHISNYQQFTIHGGHHPHMESPADLVAIVEKTLK
ncbi:alpha/beta hydrolase [Thalassotalea fonticola]|uniref:Alpha/beta hydrolase n=1 Tax=Thalassotalea fonticola TaxID=3065649 RepID=A0ABZ0GR57_9GAMM|nr:alpha/beta hydrolase [Colwelliaceae bacterium S1-1]